MPVREHGETKTETGGAPQSPPRVGQALAPVAQTSRRRCQPALLCCYSHTDSGGSLVRQPTELAGCAWHNSGLHRAIQADSARCKERGERPGGRLPFFSSRALALSKV